MAKLLNVSLLFQNASFSWGIETQTYEFDNSLIKKPSPVLLVKCQTLVFLSNLQAIQCFEKDWDIKVN